MKTKRSSREEHSTKTALHSDGVGLADGRAYPPRIVILGPSGIGKTPLTKLFKLDCWHPRRVRAPRNAEDAKTCLTPEAFAQIERDHADQTALYEGARNLRVYRDCSLFKVRDSDQCLDHTPAARDSNQPLLMEIFSPIFLELVTNRDRISEAMSLDLRQLLIIILNPEGSSCGSGSDAPPELLMAVQSAITERSRLLGKGIDLADIVRRVGSVREEYQTWQKLMALAPDRVVECVNWPHFEFRYMERGRMGAVAELVEARETLWATAEAQCPGALAGLDELMRRSDEISTLQGIA